jgi:CheY-like chemotaxis protein
VEQSGGSGDRLKAMRQGRVLVVDDEPRVGRAIGILLEEEHEVTVVGGARQALSLLHSGKSYDVILCDVVMPGMDGLMFYQAVRREHPDHLPRIVFVTGGLLQSAARALLRVMPSVIIEKPPEPEQLRAFVRQRVREQLEREGSGSQAGGSA